jgi:Pup amidohydrolase
MDTNVLRASLSTEPWLAAPARDFEANGFGCIPKLVGADVELANFVLGVDDSRGTAALASRLLLREINGLPESSSGQYWLAGLGAADISCQQDPQDWGRRYLACNGGCCYIDLDHLELAQPEVRSARDHVAAWHAMLVLARQALRQANARLPGGRRIVALANNSDHHAHSFGSHLNVLLRRSAYDALFQRRLDRLLFLAAYQVSSIVFTGAGKVGSENGAGFPASPYQISQRADWIETLFGPQTTVHRPLINTRDEPLCGWNKLNPGHPCRQLARLHVIFYDSNLCHKACFLKVGVLQIITAMLEAGQVHSRLLLEDPLEALARWSHDPSLQVRARLLNGDTVTAVELQLLFAEAATTFVDAGGCDGVVPEANLILSLWGETLARLRCGDFPVLARHLDWVLKLTMLERARARLGLSWDAAELKRLDLVYSDLDGGLYWAWEKQGALEPLVTPEHVERLTHSPPEDTRAWTRAALLARAEPDEVEGVDWDEIRFRLRGVDGWPVHRTVALPNPLAHTRRECERAVTSAVNLEELVATLTEESSVADESTPEQTLNPYERTPTHP